MKSEMVADRPMGGEMSMRTLSTGLMWMLGSIWLAALALVLLALWPSPADPARASPSEARWRIAQAGDIAAAGQARAIAARSLLLVASPGEREAEVAAAHAAHARLHAGLGRLQVALDSAAGSDDAERQRFAELARVESRHGPAALAIVELAAAGRREEVVRRLADEADPGLDALLHASQAYVAAAGALAADGRPVPPPRPPLPTLPLLAAALAVGLATTLVLAITRPGAPAPGRAAPDTPENTPEAAPDPGAVALPPPRERLAQGARQLSGLLAVLDHFGGGAEAAGQARATDPAQACCAAATPAPARVAHSPTPADCHAAAGERD